MSVTTFIYALCEPNSKTVRYIGKSDDPKRRFRAHFRQSISAKTHLGNWLRLLDSQGRKPDMVVLREVPCDQWELAEERYIRLARGCGMKLVNGTDGGDGLYNPSPETRAKLAANNKARVWSEESRKKASESRLSSAEAKAHMDRLHAAQVGVPHSAEHNANISRALTGGKRTPEVCAAMSKARTGVPHTAERKANISRSLTGGKRTPEVCAAMTKSRKGFCHAAHGQFKRYPLFSDGGGI